MLQNTQPDIPQDYRWVVVQVIPGKESKVQRDIKTQMAKNNISQMIRQYFAPDASTPKTRKSKAPLKVLPGYLAMDIIISPDVINTIKNIDGFIRFLGPYKLVPKALTESEVESLLNIEKQQQLRPDLYFTGQTVNILQGPFKSFKGVVVSIDSDKSVCTLEVEILGRKINIEELVDNIEIYE